MRDLTRRPRKVEEGTLIAGSSSPLMGIEQWYAIEALYFVSEDFMRVILADRHFDDDHNLALWVESMEDVHDIFNISDEVFHSKPERLTAVEWEVLQGFYEMTSHTRGYVRGTYGGHGIYKTFCEAALIAKNTVPGLYAKDWPA